MAYDEWHGSYIIRFPGGPVFDTSVDSKELCHKDIVVLSQFCAEVIT